MSLQQTFIGAAAPTLLGEAPVVNPDVLQQTAERIEAKLPNSGIGVQVVSATAVP